MEENQLGGGGIVSDEGGGVIVEQGEEGVIGHPLPLAGGSIRMDYGHESGG